MPTTETAQATFFLQGLLRNRELILKRDPQGFTVIDGKTSWRTEYEDVADYQLQVGWNDLRGLTCFLFILPRGKKAKGMTFEFWRPRDKSKTRSFRLQRKPSPEEQQVPPIITEICESLERQLQRVTPNGSL